MEEYKDSVTYGTPGKGGAVKVYFSLSEMSDEDVLSLVKRAKNLYNVMCGDV